jgi:uncharacterized membrane protein YdbT with pleckstrin-like domain
MSDDNSKPNVLLHESTYSFAFKILVLQLVAALSLSLVTVFLFFLIPPSGGSNTQLTTALIITSICLQTLDAVLLIYLVLRWRNTQYVIMPDEIAIHQGILSAHTTIHKINNIEAVEVNQSLLGKLFNYGTISFFSPSLNTRVAISNVSNPQQYAGIIKQAGK